MSLQAATQTFCDQIVQHTLITAAAHDRKWYAVYTIPQHEKSALKQLNIREVEAFLPTYEICRLCDAPIKPEAPGESTDDRSNIRRPGLSEPSNHGCHA